MPLAYADNVPCSEMRGLNLHQGPRTAGNQSMLAYRSDKGIPGYTGYCPGWSTVPVPISVSKHTGRIPAGATPPGDGTLADGQQAQKTQSEYHSSYKVEPAAASSKPQPTLKRGGGYCIEERQRQAASSDAAFVGATTYRTELLGGPAFEAQQRQQLEGLPATLVHYQAARDHREQPADHQRMRTGSSLSATTAGTSTGLVGYRTTYGSLNRPLEEAKAAAAAAQPGAALRPQSCPGQGSTDRLRMAVTTSSVARRFEGSSSYSRDFGTLGSGGPKRLATADHSQQARLATTHELDSGTSRACRQPPGYTGFVPAASSNPTAVQQGAGLASLPDAKAAMLLSGLDQYSRSMLAGCTHHKPKAGAAATTVLPAHGPTADTTQGFVNLQVLKSGLQRAHQGTATHGINSRTGLMSFFTGGVETVSENGLAEAQHFFQGRRPLGGRMKHA